MARPGTDAINSEKFISLPQLNVSKTAENFGFKKVLFPDKNVAKFIKVLSLNSQAYYQQRVLTAACILENGRLISAYDKSMLEPFLTYQDKFIYVGIKPRNHLNEEFETMDKLSYIYENGWPGLETSKQSTCAFMSTGPFNQYVYDTETETLISKKSDRAKE